MNSISQKRRQPSSPPPAPLPRNQPQMLQSAPDMHRIKQSESNPRRAQTSPSSGAWQAPQGVFSQHPQHFDPTYRRASTNPYDSNDPSSASSTNMTPQTPSGPGMPPSTQPDLSDLTSHSVPDLSAMMFPTSDPFAYPNQPMTTLENQNFVKQENVADIYSPSTTAPPFQNFNPQFQMPNYMMSPNQQGDWGVHGMNGEPLTMSGSEDLVGMNAPWPQQPQQQPQQRQQDPRGAAQQGSYDQLFGEDWSGWMSQGYRR